MRDALMGQEPICHLCLGECPECGRDLTVNQQLLKALERIAEGCQDVRPGHVSYLSKTIIGLLARDAIKAAKGGD